MKNQKKNLRRKKNDNKMMKNDKKQTNREHTQVMCGGVRLIQSIHLFDTIIVAMHTQW